MQETRTIKAWFTRYQIKTKGSSARQKGRTGEEGSAKKARMSAAGMSGGPQSMPMSSGMAVDAGGVSSEGSDLVGVGIVFQPTDDGTLYSPIPSDSHATQRKH